MLCRSPDRGSQSARQPKPVPGAVRRPRRCPLGDPRPMATMPELTMTLHLRRSRCNIPLSSHQRSEPTSPNSPTMPGCLVTGIIVFTVMTVWERGRDIVTTMRAARKTATAVRRRPDRSVVSRCNSRNLKAILQRQPRCWPTTTATTRDGSTPERRPRQDLGLRTGPEPMAAQ